MNTLIELFDSCQLENIASFLKFNPQKIIFVGFSDSDFNEKREAVTAVIRHIKPEITPDYVVVERFNYDDIKQKLEDIIRTNENCFFDLTGGKELVLVAMGAVSAQYQVPMYQIDLPANRLIAICRYSYFPYEENLPLSLRDAVALHCGELENCRAPRAERAFTKTVEDIWALSKGNNKRWKAETKELVAFENMYCRSEGPDTYSCEMQDFYGQRGRFGGVYTALKNSGYLTAGVTGNRLYYQYKNRHIRPYLEKSGTILESYVYSLVKELEAEGINDIHDVSMQVVLRWLDDGQDSTVTNEMDVVFMQGITPVFVSCKSGTVDKNALYELHTVADRLGGDYAKKILVATGISPAPIAKRAVLDRAEEMGITIISDASKMTRDELLDDMRNALTGSLNP